MSSSAHINNRKKDILIFGKDLTQQLHNTTLTAEKKYAINFSEQQNKFRLSLHNNEADSYLFVNGVEIYTFQEKDSLCLGNVYEDFSADNMKKTVFCRYVNDCSVDYDTTDVANSLDVHKYLIVMNNVKCLDLLN